MTLFSVALIPYGLEKCEFLELVLPLETCETILLSRCFEVTLTRSLSHANVCFLGHLFQHEPPHGVYHNQNKPHG